MRPRLGPALGGIVLLAGSGGGLWYAVKPANVSTPAPRTSVSTAAVTRTDLIDVDQEPGTLGFDRPRTLQSAVAGTITAEPDPGTVVTRDRVLYGVNLNPVRLFYGTVPLSRTLQSGVSDGRDVAELKRNLTALGYDTYSTDEHFTYDTQLAVEQWQGDHGRTETGQVGVGDVVFLPGPVRVGAHHAEPGDLATAGALLVDLTSEVRIATVNLPVANAGVAHPGDRVTVEMPAGATTPGVITKVSTTATAPATNTGQANGANTAVTQATIAVTIRIDHPAVTGSLEQTPVNVDFARSRVKNVLAVPVNALVALPGGQYAVDVLTGTTTHRVPVTTGLFATNGSGAGDVQISGPGISEGARVVVPS